MADAGFVVHLPDERRWSLGPSAFEVGMGYDWMAYWIHRCSRMDRKSL